MKTRHLVTGLIAAASVTLGVPAAHAVTDVYMTIPGIPGESVDHRYEGAIHVLALRQSLLPSSKGAEACSVEVTKLLDIAGPRLWAAAVSGQRFNQIRIDVVKGGLEAVKMYEIRLAGAHVVNITTSGDDNFTEAVTLGASSMTLTYYPQKADGSQGPGISETVSCK